ncbi:hypothetical protein EDD21DRAFT_390660, partial [Dissophora ornata]
MDSKQMKNNITNIRIRLSFADAELNEAGLDSSNEGQLKNQVRRLRNARMEGTRPLINLDPQPIVENEIHHQMQDGEASKFANVDEGGEEERHDVKEEEEEEALERSPRPQQKHWQGQGQEQLEDQDQPEQNVDLPSTSNQSKITSPDTLLDIIKNLNETARLSVEMGAITKQKKLEAKRAKDIQDNNIELKKIEMMREEKQHEHERRLAEIQADKDLAVKREELGLQAQQEMMRDMERMRREIDERLNELRQMHLQPPK